MHEITEFRSGLDVRRRSDDAQGVVIQRGQTYVTVRLEQGGPDRVYKPQDLEIVPNGR